MIKILGICGSPVKDSNAKLILSEALKSVEQEGVQTELFEVNGKNFEDCTHCNWCMARQTADKFCKLSDDMDALFPKVAEADALLISSPVYLGRLSGRLASVLDRLRCIHYGKHYLGGMKYKAGGAISVGWYRNSGIETTLASIHWAFLTFQMLIAVPGSTSTFGGSGFTSLSGTGEFDVNDRHQVLKDEYGLKTARTTAESLLELARLIKAGKNAIAAG
jgi:multimeric flavodoxin WrbA